MYMHTMYALSGSAFWVLTAATREGSGTDGGQFERQYDKAVGVAAERSVSDSTWLITMHEMWTSWLQLRDAFH